MIFSYDPRKIWPFIKINLIIALVLSVFFCPGCFTSIEGLWSIVDDFIYSFIISMLLSGGISQIVLFTGRKFPWLESPGKRFLADFIGVVVYSFIVAFILASVFSLLVWNYFTLTTFDAGKIVETTLKPIYIALGITAFFTSRSFLVEWKRAAIETEKMKNERLASKYQGLKDQLNPHFLFNSLNVLSNLVYEDADKANTFIEQLSRIYRYVLEVQNEEYVPLEKELVFAQSYMELQKTRFGDKFQFQVNIRDADIYGLVPLSLQLLLENAFKHNVATRENPLCIKINQDKDILLVENNLQKRNSEGNGTGVGLNNINERSKMLMGREVEIIESDGFFRVKIPLIKMKTAK